MPRDRTVLVCGLGLMGGSLAAALAKAGWTVLLHHRRPEVAQRAERLGYGRAVEDAVTAMGECDVAVVCAPVDAIAENIVRLASAPEGAVITDVGSVKSRIRNELVDLARTGRYVGSHPMAGSHLHGLENASADLYRGSICVVCPETDVMPGPRKRVEAMWKAVGCTIVHLDAETHDRAVVAASHLPHILASVAASQLAGDAMALAASGFRDTTRVAAGSPDLWTEILMHNQAAVIPALDDALLHLAALKKALLHADASAVREWLQAGVEGRKRFDQRKALGATADEA